MNYGSYKRNIIKWKLISFSKKFHTIDEIWISKIFNILKENYFEKHTETALWSHKNDSITHTAYVSHFVMLTRTVKGYQHFSLFKFNQQSSVSLVFNGRDLQFLSFYWNIVLKAFYSCSDKTLFKVLRNK